MIKFETECQKCEKCTSESGRFRDEGCVYVNKLTTSEIEKHCKALKETCNTGTMTVVEARRESIASKDQVIFSDGKGKSLEWQIRDAFCPGHNACWSGNCEIAAAHPTEKSRPCVDIIRQAKASQDARVFMNVLDKIPK